MREHQSGKNKLLLCHPMGTVLILAAWLGSCFMISEREKT